MDHLQEQKESLLVDIFSQFATNKEMLEAMKDLENIDFKSLVKFIVREIRKAQLGKKVTIGDVKNILTKAKVLHKDIPRLYPTDSELGSLQIVQKIRNANDSVVKLQDHLSILFKGKEDHENFISNLPAEYLVIF